MVFGLRARGGAGVGSGRRWAEMGHLTLSHLPPVLKQPTFRSNDRVLQRVSEAWYVRRVRDLFHPFLLFSLDLFLLLTVANPVARHPNPTSRAPSATGTMTTTTDSP